jgi:hypothetical protein
MLVAPLLDVVEDQQHVGATSPSPATTRASTHPAQVRRTGFNRVVDFNKSTFTGRCNLKDATFNDRLLLTHVKIKGQLEISPKRLDKVALDGVSDPTADKRPELDLSRVTLEPGGPLLLNYTPSDEASVRVDMIHLLRRRTPRWT